jgi:non-ribosomal peptide synthetase component F
VLTILLGWVSRRLSVGIAMAGDAPVMLANMTGRLRAGAELSPDDTEGAAVYFHFEDAGTGFLLTRAHFKGGGWHEQDPSTLLVRLGAVTLWIDQEPDE